MQAMNESPESLSALNEQLAALIEAGVPMDVGMTGDAPLTPEMLRQMNRTVTERVSRGETLFEAFAGDEPLASARYRCLVRLGMQSGSAQAALEGPRQVGIAVDQTTSALRRALLYPLVVCGMAYLGLMAFCSTVVPRLDGIYETLRIPPRIGLKSVELARQTMPYWGLIPVVALAYWGAEKLWKRPREGTLARLAKLIPGVRQSLSLERAANFAAAVVELLEHGMSREEAMRLAACASGEGPISAGVRAVGAAARQGEFPAIDNPTAKAFPPLLRWALWQNDPATDRGEALRLTAEIYRAAAERRTARVQTLAPVLACLFVGGVVTLGYCLALFVPLIEMLEYLATSISS
jgi:type II secretory pathway component PulF